MNKNASYAKESLIETPGGDVRIRSFCTPDEIHSHHFDTEFGTHAQFKSLYTRKESLEADATDPDANITLALSEEDHIVGFAVLAYPDEGERWLDLGFGLMMELRVIEVCRSWRSGRLGNELLGMALDHPRIEDVIVYMVGYSWTWDLDGTARRAQAYRQILIRLFESRGFVEYETNEPNICLKQENLFMCRVGSQVPDEVVDRFNWLRFGITPETEIVSGVVGTTGNHTQTDCSLFAPLKAENLTFLGIYYNWKKDWVSVRAGLEWDGAVEWDGYNHIFSADHPLMSDTRFIGHDQTLRLFDQYGLRGYLDDIIERIKQSRHLGLECYLEPRRNIQVVNFIHSNTLSRGQLYHARRSGEICIYDSAEELEMIADGLNMSRAASFKNAGARLPFGGGCIAVRSPALDTADHASLGFLAYVLDRTRTVVGPDRGFPAEIVDGIRREGYSYNIVGGDDSRIGSPRIHTAYGVYLALKEAAYVKFGSLSLAGRKIAVQGVGAVGSALIEKYLAPDEADIYVCDIHRQPIDRLKTKLSRQISVIDPETALEFDGEILVPCAQGGILDADRIGKLNVDIVVGAANNTLRAADQKEEIHLSKMMENQGILFQVDWMQNTGGIIAVSETYLHPRRTSLERVMRQVEHVCRHGVRENFKAARSNGVTPTAQAYEHYNAMIYV